MRELDFSLLVPICARFRWMRSGVRPGHLLAAQHPAVRLDRGTFAWVTSRGIPRKRGKTFPLGEKKCFGGSIDARGASLQLQEQNVEKMRRFEREGIMGIVALSGARVYCMRELVHNAEALSRVMHGRRGRQSMAYV